MPKPKKVKIDPKEMRCINCKYAYLMRSQPYNPIVAECTKTNERFVAESIQTKKCSFEKLEGEIVVHDMIFLK